MSTKFEEVKSYFELGVWSAAKVHKAVEKGWITAEEFTTITGEIFS